MPLLTSIFAAPLIAALIIALIPRNYRFIIRSVALFATLVSAIQAVRAFVLFDPAVPGFQFEEMVPWVGDPQSPWHRFSSRCGRH